jgi:hypothetical protein
MARAFCGGLECAVALATGPRKTLEPTQRTAKLSSAFKFVREELAVISHLVNNNTAAFDRGANFRP